MPKILTTDRPTREMAAEAIKAIIDADDPPTLFARDDDNVLITRDGEQLRIMDKALVKRLGEDCADWKKNKSGGTVPCAMPDHVADHMLSHAPWNGLPKLARMIRSPVILPDARVLDRTGYDPDTGLYLALEPGFTLPPIETDPSEDDMMSSFRLIDSYQDEFVYATPADKANGLVMQVSHLMRSFIGERALLPMFALDAPMRSTGKTTLGQTCGWLALGTEPAVAGQIAKDEEWAKQIASTLKHEVEILMFDNLDVRLDDPTLAAVLTTEGKWAGRLLGGNDLVNARNKTTFIVTGNNLEVGPDLQRRVIYIRLDANMADPSRRQFKRTDFRGAMLAARPRLLAAFFTWVRRWLQLGSPVQGAPVMASYNPFVRAAHGLLSLVGVDSFLGNLGSFRDAQDADGATWARWLAEWFRLWGSEQQETGGLARTLDNPQDDQRVFSEIRPSELAVYSDVDRKKLPVTLGYVLKKRIDQIYGGLKLIRGTVKDGYTRWRVIPVEPIEADSPPSSPPPPETKVSPSEVGVVGEVGSGTGSGAVQGNFDEILARVGYTQSPTTPTTPTENKAPERARVTRASREARKWTPSAFSRATRARVGALFSLDTETTGLLWWHEDRIRLVTFAWEDGVIWADVWETPEALEDLKQALAELEGPLAMHNAAFDLGMLSREGIPAPARIFDTMLASQLLDSGGDERPAAGLDDLAKRYFDLEMDKTLQGPEHWLGELTERHVDYACLDAGVTHDLAVRLMTEVATNDLAVALEIEHGFVPFMMALHANGLPLDQIAWLSLEQHAGEEKLRLGEQLAELYGKEPPEKWTQKGWLEEYLQEHGLVREWTTSGKPSTRKAALQEVASDPLIATYLAWKPNATRTSGWGSEYLRKNLAPDRKLHGDYRQLGTRTGRLSCDKPNMQNIPKGPHRQAIHPGDGRCFVKADYSQLQLVIIADETRDPIMLAAYDPAVPHKQRPDLHTITARNVLGLHIPRDERVTGAHRTVSKNINFGLCYGMGWGKLAGMIERETGQPCDENEAKLRKYKYFQTYDGVKHWHGLGKHLSSRGRAYDDDEYPNPIDLRSPSGRRRSGVWKFGQKVNSPIQMREADGVKTGLALLLPRLQAFNDARPVMMIHDEVIVECDIAEAEQVKAVVELALEEGMNRWLKYTTATVEAEIVKNYAGDAL